MEELRLEPLSLSNCYLLADLMNRHYERQRPVEYFHWQYFDYPLPVVAMGAFDGNRLVGHFGLQRKPMSPTGFIDQVMDIIIDADYRGGELFGRLFHEVKARMDTAAPSMVLANPAGIRACVRTLGFTQVAKIDSLVLRSLAMLDSTKTTDSPTQRHRLRLDGGLLRWRFLDHPIFEYHFHGQEDGALVVSKLFTLGDSCQGDLVFYQNQPALSLWRKTCLDLVERGATRINCWAFPGTSEREALLELGFELDAPQERYFGLKSDQPNLSEARAWNIVQADTEHF